MVCFPIKPGGYPVVEVRYGEMEGSIDNASKPGFEE
jgi:hypothetical protein